MVSFNSGSYHAVQEIFGLDDLAPSKACLVHTRPARRQS